MCREFRIVAALSVPVLLVVAAAQPCAGGVTDLDRTGDARRLPYTVVDERLLAAGRGVVPAESGTNFLFCDLDGDGCDEFIRIGEVGVTSHTSRDHVAVTRWQFNLPVAYCWRDPGGVVEGAFDVDADGAAEIVCSAHTEDRIDWRLWALDGATGEPRSTVALAGGPDLRADGRWDGLYRLIGVLDVPTPTGPRRSYIVVANAGFDLEPRGVLAVDCRSGQEHWRYQVGPKPAPGQAALADLDGDGVPEIVFTGTAVNNLAEGQTYNGTRDDHAMVFVLGADGSLRWSHRLFRGTGAALLAVEGARDAAPGRVFIAGSRHDEAHRNVVRILAGRDGAVLDEAPMPAPASGFAFVPRGGAEADLWWTGGEFLCRIPVQDGRLGAPQTVAAAGAPLQLDAVADVLPPPGPELLLVDARGDAYVLGQDGACLAAYRAGGDAHPAVRHLAVVRPDSATTWLLGYGMCNEPSIYAGLAPTPASTTPAIWTAGLVATGIGATLAYRRRRRAAAASTVSLRELRLQVLGRLELSNHGAIGALQTVRRLTWLVGGVATMPGASPEMTAKLARLEQECRERALPDLQETLDLARAAQLDERAVLNGKEALALVERLLGGVAETGGAVDELLAVEGDLRSAGEDAERAFQKIRRQATAAFRVDLREAVDRVLAAYADELADVAVTLPPPTQPSPAVRIDPQELVFVLDNLVGNALRAMPEGGRRELTIAWRTGDGLVRCEVGDTGCGIVPDDWERIMQPGYSTRKGGGLGLSRSRSLLRKYEGDLAVAGSTLGLGTTMALSIPLATPPLPEEPLAHAEQ